MKKTESTEHEKLDGSASQTDKELLNTELIESHEIEDTPFTAVRKENEWYLLMGKYRLNEKSLESLEQVLEEAKNATWNRITQVMGVMIEEYKKEPK